MNDNVILEGKLYRRCIVKWFEKEDPKADPADTKSPWKPHTGKGLFHQWGSDHDEGTNGFLAVRTFAVVELDDGRVKEITPENMKFIDPLAVMERLMQE
jgi:hypothetical protein